MGGAHQEHDCKDLDRSSTKRGRERERKRKDCKDGRWGARGIATCRPDVRRGTREEPTAAAATEAQTAAHIAAEAAAHTQSKLRAHTRQTVGDCPTQRQVSEGTGRSKARPRPCPNGSIEHGIEMPDLKERRECTALQLNAPGNCVSNQQSAHPPEVTGPCWDHEHQKECKGCDYCNHATKCDSRDASAVPRHHHYRRGDSRERSGGRRRECVTGGVGRR